MKIGGQVKIGEVVLTEEAVKTEDPAGDQSKNIAFKESSKQLLLFPTC
jgi:hypothetical protein